MLLKIAGVFACWVLSLAVLAFRGNPAKDAGLLVLRDESAVLRRHDEAAQAGTPAGKPWDVSEQRRSRNTGPGSFPCALAGGSSLGTASLAWRAISAGP